MPTYEEQQLLAIYNLNGTRTGLVFELEATQICLP